MRSGHGAWALGRYRVRPNRATCRPQRAVRKRSSGPSRRRAAHPDRDAATGTASRPPHLRGVAPLRALGGEAHPGPAVRQPEGGAGGGDRDGPVGVEAEEDDAAPPRRVDRVEPHVGLQERAGPRHGRAGREPGADHPERDQPDVGPAVEHVRPDSGREEAGHRAGVDGPVQERDVAPALPEQVRAGQRGSGDADRLDGHDSTGSDTAARYAVRPAGAPRSCTPRAVVHKVCGVHGPARCARAGFRRGRGAVAVR